MVSGSVDYLTSNESSKGIKTMACLCRRVLLTVFNAHTFKGSLTVTLLVIQDILFNGMVIVNW